MNPSHKQLRQLLNWRQLTFIGLALLLTAAGLWWQRGQGVNAQSGPQISARAAGQMAELAALKRSKTAIQQKMSSRLFLSMMRVQRRLSANLSTLRTSVQTNDAGRPLVDIAVTNRNAGLKRLDGLKDVVVVNAVGKSIRAYIPFNLLEYVASFPEIVAIREPKPFFNASLPLAAASATDHVIPTQPGFAQRSAPVRERLRAALAKAGTPKGWFAPLAINTSEGDRTHRAFDARGAFAADGTGVKIGVISDGVNSLASLQASGDLPAGVTVLPGQAGSGDEGSAMLEIVHDLAPKAQLYFGSAIGGPAQFAQNIRDLSAAGCRVIVDDIIYLDESPLHDGQPANSTSTLAVVAQAVNDVTAAGTLYFSSAGNEGNKTNGTSGTWEGNFVGNGTPSALAGAGPVNNFGDGGQSILVEFGGGNPPLLHWSDPLGESSNDYDLYVLDSSLTIIFDASDDTQDGTPGSEPVEFIGGGTFANERLVIAKFAGADRFLSLRVFRGELDDNLSTSGSTHGHSATANAFSVAATPADAPFGPTLPGPFPNPFNNTNRIESFSSDGPRQLIFKADGTLFTPGNFLASGAITRQKPDITAADGVLTAAPGFNPFYGTSAAAPHAAALAGLLLSANPALTPAQVRTVLTSSAIDIEAAGTDRDSGAGIVMAFEALQFIGATPVANPVLGTVAKTETGGDGDGFVEPCERIAFTLPINNIGALAMTAVSATLSTATPNLVINQATSAYPDIAVSSTQNNTTPFVVTVGCNAACSTEANFMLTLNFSGGPSPKTFNFSFRMGGLSTPQTFSFTGPPVGIPDSNDMTGNSPGAQVFADFLATGFGPGSLVGNVKFRFDGTACSAVKDSPTVGLDHSFVNDLELVLKAPDGTSVLLIDRTDGNGNNFCNTELDDASAGPSIQTVVSANAPFTGSFKPNVPLAGLIGAPANGTWQLGAQDFFQTDTGNIRAFSVTITPLDCTTSACVLTAPANLTVPPAVGLGSAIVNYPNPGLTGGCGIVACNPPSGSSFAIGTTTVTCTPQAGSAVSFSVTVTCPPLTVSPSSLAAGTAGLAYSQQLTLNGTFGNLVNFTLTDGALPTGLTLSASGLVSGTPTQGGTFSFTALGTDTLGCMGTQVITLTINCPIYTPVALAAGTAGTAYNQSLSVSPNLGGPFNFALMGGALPPGLTLSNGVVSGTPTVAGTFNFQVTVTGSVTLVNCSNSVSYTLVVNCPTLTLTASLPSGMTGTAYNQTVTASPAGGNYSYALTTNILPPGLSLNSTTGAITGTPTAAGNYTFVITATGWGGCTKTQTYNLLITATCAGLTLNPTSLPGGTVGTAYSQTITATGGTAPYTFAVTAGTLPTGLTLATGGALTGTPSAAGTFNFTVTATGVGGCASSKSYSVVVTCPSITITTASLPNATAGNAYNQTVAVSPAGAYTFGVASGNLPPGLTLNATTGAITGTATATGTYAFSVKAERGAGCSATKAFTVVVACPTIAVNPVSLLNGIAGTVYSQTLSATPSGNYSFTLSGGTLPGGLTLSSLGVLGGTPTVAGSFTFTVKATGFGSCFGTRSYTVVIGAACATVTLPALPATGTLGGAYTGNLAGTTPAGSYTFSVDSGTLPTGVVIDNLFGALLGTPTASGTFVFTLKATSSTGCTGTRGYMVVISSSAALAQFADYDGDGKADPALWRAASGAWDVRLSGSQSPMTRNWGAAGDLALLGDYDGDGKSDLAIFRPSDATWYIQRSSDGGYLIKQWGAATDVPVPGDYDGDGKTDIASFRLSTGTWTVLRSRDQQTVVTAWGAGSAPYLDVPVAGDYDGDGKTDLAVFRRATGYWYAKLSGNGSTLAQAWGLGTDVPVANDYDGDGKTDLAVWRAATGVWYIAQSSNNQTRTETWGAGVAPYGDQVGLGDYDGDGKTDLAVWRASVGMWYQLLSGQSSSAAMQTIQQGQAGDRPVGPNNR